MNDASNDWEAAIYASVDLARRSGHPYIGTDHLLLGALQQSSAAGVILLASQGLSYEAVYAQWRGIGLTPESATTPMGAPSPTPSAVVRASPPITGKAQEFVDAISFLPASLRAITRSVRLVRGSVQVDHLLAALLSDRGGVSAGLILAVLHAQGRSPTALLELEKSAMDLINPTRDS